MDFLQDLANYTVGYTSYIETLKNNITTHTHTHGVFVAGG
jgi:hypothetical protein